MKLIDVLNKIANGELKEGTRIKIGKDIYSWNTGFSLGVEVELIEPQEPNDNTKIEELIDWYATTNDDKSTEMLLRIVWNKLNEVIRYINKED